VPVSESKLEMKIDLNIIEHLGLKMYTSLPAVIAEYVANARDAGATEVDINIPTDGCMEDYAISISDNGCGMSVKKVNEKFLVVGKNRRGEERTDEIVAKSGKKREVMVRKGLGKLAGFEVARS
jgi:signal transduction histidine kinase